MCRFFIIEDASSEPLAFLSMDNPVVMAPPLAEPEEQAKAENKKPGKAVVKKKGGRNKPKVVTETVQSPKDDVKVVGGIIYSDASKSESVPPIKTCTEADSDSQPLAKLVSATKPAEKPEISKVPKQAGAKTKNKSKPKKKIISEDSDSGTEKEPVIKNINRGPTQTSLEKETIALVNHQNKPKTFIRSKVPSPAVRLSSNSPIRGISIEESKSNSPIRGISIEESKPKTPISRISLASLPSFKKKPRQDVAADVVEEIVEEHHVASQLERNENGVFDNQIGAMDDTSFGERISDHRLPVSDPHRQSESSFHTSQRGTKGIGFLTKRKFAISKNCIFTGQPRSRIKETC
jgi:hypothetical protein